MINKIIKLFLKVKAKSFYKQDINVYKIQEKMLLKYIKIRPSIMLNF